MPIDTGLNLRQFGVSQKPSENNLIYTCMFKKINWAKVLKDVAVIVVSIFAGAYTEASAGIINLITGGA